MRSFPVPAYAKHDAYTGLLAAANLYLASGGYGNDWQLDDATNSSRFFNQIRTLQKRHPALLTETIKPSSLGGVSAKEPLSLSMAAYVFARAAGMDTVKENAIQTMVERGWILQETIGRIADRERLTNGEAFMLIRDVVGLGAGVVFE